MNRFCWPVFYSSSILSMNYSRNALRFVKVPQSQQAAAHHISQLIFTQPISVPQIRCNRSTTAVLRHGLLLTQMNNTIPKSHPTFLQKCHISECSQNRTQSSTTARSPLPHRFRPVSLASLESNPLMSCLVPSNPIYRSRTPFFPNPSSLSSRVP